MFKRIIAATLLSFSLASTSTAGGHSKDIADTAVAAGSFETLVTAVAAADLVDVLRVKGLSQYLRLWIQRSRLSLKEQ